MLGLGLVVLSLVMLAILVTSDRSDATSQTVNSLSGQISNILGSIGAEVAAVQISMIGIVAAYGLAVVPLIWAGD